MSQSRRSWLGNAACMLGALGAAPVLFSQMSPTPRPLPSPNAPNQNFPPGLNGPDNHEDNNQHAVDPRIREEIKSDVENLFDLALDLKQQVQKSDSTSTLSLNMVKTAQQIEKLAKKIKNLSRG